MKLMVVNSTSRSQNLVLRGGVLALNYIRAYPTINGFTLFWLFAALRRQLLLANRCGFAASQLPSAATKISKNRFAVIVG